jgi:tetratricopeptide (TPR) repeat protein
MPKRLALMSLKACHGRADETPRSSGVRLNCLSRNGLENAAAFRLLIGRVDTAEVLMQKKIRVRRKLTRRELRNLDLEIRFLEGLVERDPKFVEALRVLSVDYNKRGRRTDAVRVDEYLAQVHPDDALAHYNLACSYALTRQFNHAVMALNRAIQLGYCDFHQLFRDTDLAALRKHPLFEKVLAKIDMLEVKVG